MPERKYKEEPLKIEPLETITENKLPILPPQLITSPPQYQCLGNNVSFISPQTTSLPTPDIAPIPIAPNIQQQSSTFHGSSYVPPLGISKTAPYEIPQPSSTSTNQQNLIPSVKLMEVQNPPPIDFNQLKLAANKMHNRSHSLDILKMMTNHIRMKSHILTLIRQIHMKYKLVLSYEQLTCFILFQIHFYLPDILLPIQI